MSRHPSSNWRAAAGAIGKVVAIALLAAAFMVSYVPLVSPSPHVNGGGTPDAYLGALVPALFGMVFSGPPALWFTIAAAAVWAGSIIVE